MAKVSKAQLKINEAVKEIDLALAELTTRRKVAEDNYKAAYNNMVAIDVDMASKNAMRHLLTAPQETVTPVVVAEKKKRSKKVAPPETGTGTPPPEVAVS